MSNGNPFYNKYSKHPDFASGIQGLINNFMMMKQFRQAQEQRKWQRGIQQQQLDLQRQRLNRPKEPSITERRWEKADFNVGVGAWTREQGENYKLTGQIPEPRVKYPATTVANVKGLFKITDEEWKGMPNKQKGEYFKEFQLRTRPSTAKEKLTPEEAQAKAIFGKQSNLIKAAMGRLDQHKKSLTAMSKVTQAESYGVIPPHKLKAQTELGNIDKLIEQLGRISTRSMASGRPLMKEYESALQKLLRSTPQDLRSGKLYGDIVSSWAEKQQGFQVGQRRTAKDGTVWKFIGNDQWQQIK